MLQLPRTTLSRSALSAAAALLLAPALATAAQAAPATNDTVATATVVSALPTTITEDTRAATTDATDAALNDQCGAPATNASVWFTYTAAADGGVIADMSGSDYSGGFMVTEGNPANGNLVTCGPTTVGFATTAGQQYYIVAFSDTATNGGALQVVFDKAPPAPEVSLTVNPRGTAYKDGSAKLSGTYSCTNADFVSDIEGTLTQRVGRIKISGDFIIDPLRCDGQTHPWDAVVTSATGLFRGGKGASVTFVFACGLFDCSVGYAEQTVQLSSGGKRA